MIQYRTDLALESFQDSCSESIPGVRVSRWESNGVVITEVAVEDNEASRQLGKPRGVYLTLECPLLRQGDPDAGLALTNLLSEELTRVLPPEDGTRPILVVGLGNRSITPDALGPGVIDRILVTRHLMGGPLASPELRSVCAVAPGVLGVTGIETMEMVESVVRSVDPRAVICVDSLAARDSRRIGSVIQLADVGIQPGAGVGNQRKPLTEETLGAPVISLGMPTVIYAATLARDAFAWLSRQSGDDDPHEDALEDMEKSLLSADIGEMIVTPREIDAMIDNASDIIAAAINRALQPDLSAEEISALT